MMPLVQAFGRSAFGQGLLSNVLNLDHICFALMTGLMLVSFLQKRRLLASALAGNALGLGLGAYAGTIPGAQLLVGISLGLLVAIVTVPERFQRGLVFTLGAVGILHGMLHANRYGSFASTEDFLFYLAGTMVAILALALSFQNLLRFLAQKPKNLSSELEHILVAVASGSALAYIVMSF